MQNYIKILLLFVLLAVHQGFARNRIITDMAGRKVSVPENIKSVVPYDNKTNVILYPVAGNLMLAKARAMENPHKKYIATEYMKLKEIDTKNAEEIIKLKPDLLVVAAFVDQKASLEHYDEFSQKVKIPLVVVDAALMQLDKTYEFLGSLLMRSEATAPCVQFIQEVYKSTQMYMKNKRVQGTAYMANDIDGLRTSPFGSSHAELFDVMKINNAANVSLDARGFAQVSVEQILNWNPDYVFCVGKGESSPYRTILKSAIWKNTNAVKSKRVFFVPAEPYSWFDIPPSVNRIPGLIWFADIFYNQPTEQTKLRIKDFYRIFYHYNLSDKEYTKLFIWQ